MVNLAKLYKERYYVSPLDLADYAETNRLHILIACPLVFLFGLGDLIFLFCLHYQNLQDYISSILYFGFFTLISVVVWVYSVKVKNVAREKAYILKSIPIYTFFCIGISAAIYNFYVLGQPYNGVLAYIMTDIIVISIFTISPLFFFIVIALGLAVLIPGVYSNFGVTGLMDTILIVILLHGFSLYRRYSEKKIILMLKKQKKNLEAKTFGNFTLLYDNKVVKFSRSKSPELLAYLIYKKGSSVQTKELLTVLYGGHADSAKYGASLRNLIVDIKQNLAELEIQNFFITEYNNFRINPEALKCDYYDFLSGDENAVKSFAGEFMSQYSWAEDTTGFLEMKALKK